MIFLTCAANAIWFVPKFSSWAIGPLDFIGKDIRGITSSRYTGLKFNPYDVPSLEWWYFYNDDWNLGESRALEYRVKQINNDRNLITKPSPFSYQCFKVKVPFRSNKSKDLSNKK